MSASSKRALVGAVTANLAVAVVKFIVGALTNSTVMIAEGIHSLVDSGNSGLMMFGLWRSRRPADDAHPFGYGMELYFWSFVVAMVIFGGGGGLSIYEGVRALAHPHPVTHLWANYVVIGAAALFEGASLAVGLREFAAYRRERRFVGSTLKVIRASKDPAIFITVLEDTAALAGLLVAAVGLTLSHFLRTPAFDAVASMVIGLILMTEAALLGFECRGLIIGETARPLVVATIRRVVGGYEELGVLEDLRTLQLGPDSILLALRMRLPPNLAAADLADVVRRLERDLRGEHASIKHVVFYVSPVAGDDRPDPPPGAVAAPPPGA
jgi:cation diffusion facilitator family transporter